MAPVGQLLCSPVSVIASCTVSSSRVQLQDGCRRCGCCCCFCCCEPARSGQSAGRCLGGAGQFDVCKIMLALALALPLALDSPRSPMSALAAAIVGPVLSVLLPLATPLPPFVGAVCVHSRLHN